MQEILRKAGVIAILFAAVNCAQAEIDPACPQIFQGSTSWKIESIYNDPSIFRVSSGQRSYVLGRDELAPLWPSESTQVTQPESLPPPTYPEPLEGLKLSLEVRCDIQVTIGHRLPEIAPGDE